MLAKDLFVSGGHTMAEAIQEAFDFKEIYLMISNEIAESEEETIKEEKPKVSKDEGFESAWLLYRRKGSKKKALEQWARLTDEEREVAKGHIPAYIDSVSDIKYQKDFERYLRDKCFNDVVYKNGRVLFDVNDKKEDTSSNETTKLIIGGVEYR
jgi:hypothetical protein